MMVEVFKTDVQDQRQADMLLHQIHHTFTDYRASFDLEDCDKILRIKARGTVNVDYVVHLLKASGFKAEVLSDETETPLAGQKILYCPSFFHKN